MDPVLFARTKAAALDLCRQVAAMGLPFAEALAEVEAEHEAAAPEAQEGLLALLPVLAVAQDCADLGAALGAPVAVIEPAAGAHVALPGGLGG